MNKESLLKNKKLIIPTFIIVLFIILIISSKDVIIKKYKEIKLQNINKDITFTGEYLNNNHTETYIGASFYVDISKKRIYYTIYFNFKDGKTSRETLIKDKKLTDEEYNIIMDLVNNSSTKKTKGSNDICYKIIYNDKTLYTNEKQTNEFTIKILWKLEKNIEI